MKGTIPFEPKVVEITEPSVILNIKKLREFYTELRDNALKKSDELLERGNRWRLRGQAVVNASAEIGFYTGVAAGYDHVLTHIDIWEEKVNQNV